MIRTIAAALLLSLTAAPAAAAAAPRTWTIVIDKMKFGPVPAQLRVGDTIKWVNKDMFRHTATARDNSFNVDLPAGKAAAMPIRRAGNTAFYCKFHPGMKGALNAAR